jgi:crossover junction endodeoxyribonuclease RusA
MITLPWPPSSLSPNGSHGHYHARRRAAGKYREDSMILLRSQNVPKLYVDPPIMLALTFCPPTKRLSDLDNLLARAKHGVDALAEVLGVNDQSFEFTLRRGDPVKGGAVYVAIGDRSPSGPGRATGPVHESPGAQSAIAQRSLS